MEQSVALTGARVALSPFDSDALDITITGDRISGLAAAQDRRTCDDVIDLSGYLILPGLINAHDHLEFNLFPRLGHRLYGNASEWAADIYRPESPVIARHLNVPKPARLLWGALKNLLSGVTTVAHHNAFPGHLDTALPVRVVRDYGWAHSLAFEKNVQALHQATPASWPFILHAAEGIDDAAKQEIDRLHALRILTANTVLVHGVAIQPHQIEWLTRLGVSLVWCPRSNHFLFGQSLSADVLASNLPIALGSDSAMTSGGDLIDEMQTALRDVPPERVYAMVTANAANILRLDPGFGAIQADGPADLMVLKDSGQSPAEALAQGLMPEAVLIRGELRCFSSAIEPRLRPLIQAAFVPVTLEGRGTRWVDVPIEEMLRDTVPHLGAVDCGGKRVTC